MENRSIFYDDWRDCLRAHYRTVIRENDMNNEKTLYTVLLDTGFTVEEIDELRIEMGLIPVASPTPPRVETDPIEEPAPVEDFAPTEESAPIDEIVESQAIAPIAEAAIGEPEPPAPVTETLISEPSPIIEEPPPPAPSQPPAHPMVQQSMF
jgi:hypothetical protein